MAQIKASFFIILNRGRPSRRALQRHPFAGERDGRNYDEAAREHVRKGRNGTLSAIPSVNAAASDIRFVKVDIVESISHEDGHEAA